MTIDVGFLDSRLMRYLRNRTVTPDAVYWSEGLEENRVHFLAEHLEWGHRDDDAVACYQLVSTDDAQHLYLKTHDDRTSAILVRSRIVAVEPDLFWDSRAYEARQSYEKAVVASEDAAVRRYMRYGRTTYRTQAEPRARRDPGASYGRGYSSEPAF